MPDRPDEFAVWARAVELLSDRGAFSPDKAAGHILHAIKTNDVRLRDHLGNELRWEQTPEAAHEREAEKIETARARDAEQMEDARRKVLRAEAKSEPRFNPLSRWRK